VSKLLDDSETHHGRFRGRSQTIITDSNAGIKPI